MTKKLLLTILSFYWAFTFAQSPSPNEVFKIAFAAYQQGNYSFAIKNYNIAIDIDPGRNYFYYNRGLAYKSMNVPDKAIQDFLQSIDLKPTAEAYYQMGLVKYEKNDFVGATADFENAKSIRLDLDKMNFYLGMMYYKNNRYDEAQKCFAEYTSNVKTSPDAYYYRGLCEAKLGRYDKAVESMKFAMMYKNNDWKLYYKMYELYLALNDKENAMYNISMVIETGMKKPEHYEERARLYKDMGNLFKYEEDMETCKTLRSASAANTN
jgi:tetratricopeptide (TPR) repeat protein